jgi:FAD/FMN-containing dehydrogenase
MSKGYLLLYTKSCPSFDDVGGIWNLQHKGTPWAIARCLNAAAVQIVVKFASDQQAKTQGPIDPRFSLVVRSGGHDMHCRSAGANSLVLDIRGLDSITLATDHRFVTIGGGVTTGNLSQFLDEYKLTSTPGLCNTVGVTGFATGGGYSVISGTYGLGVDQIIGGKLVTPTGLLIDTEDDAELLWGLRGAGNGNFGVIVELRLKVYQHPAFLGGVLLYPATETEQVLNGLSKLFNDKGHPRNFGGEFALLHVPGFGAVFHLIFTWAEPWVDKANPLADGWEWLHNCEALGTVLLNTVTESKSWNHHSNL